MKWILFLFIFASSFLAHAKVNIAVRYSPISNFIYQLDCISGTIHCSRKNIEKLWRSEFLKTTTDENHLKKWGEVMNRYEQSLDVQPNLKPDGSVRNSGLSLSSKIRIASFQSKNKAEYFERLDLLLTSQDRNTIQGVVNHLYPQYEKWWDKEPSKLGKKFVEKTTSLLKKSEISEKIDQIYSFYEVLLPDGYPITLNLFYRPQLADESSAGEQIENYSVMEFMANEDPKNRIDVAIHELCHFFFSNSSAPLYYKLQASIKNSGVNGVASYNLLNETLATALGNGVISKALFSQERWEKFFNAPQSFYNDYFVDKAAKALLPYIEDSLKNKKTLFDKDFEKNYLGVLDKTFGKELAAPKLLFKEMFLFSDSSYSETGFRNYVRKALQVNSQYTSEGNLSSREQLKTYFELPKVNAMLIVHPEHLARLKTFKILTTSQFLQMQKTYAKKKSALYAFNTANHRTVYILVGQNALAVQKLIDQIQEMRSGFVGAYKHTPFFPQRSFAVY